MASPPPARRRLPIYALFAANVISLFGNQLTALAVPWFVLSSTGSAAQTGLTAFFGILPVVLAAFFGGAIVDRLGYRRASVLSDLASGATVALIPLLHALGLLPFWLLLALVFLGALLDAPGATARAALVPELAGLAGMPIERASALVQVVDRGARLLGAPLGGLLIAVIGPQQVLLIDALSFGLSALLVAAAIPGRAPVARAAEPYLRQIADGLRFIRDDRLTLTLVLTLLVTNFLDAARFSVVLPVFASEVYGSPVALGLLFGLTGGGAVAGALIYSLVGHRLSRRWVFICAFVAVSLPAFVLALTPPLPVALLAQVLTGLAAGPINPILSAIQYERVPAELRGRVFGATTAGAYLAMPLGVLVAGYLLEGAGLPATLLLIGACYTLTTLSLTLSPTLAQMDRRPAEARPAAAGL